MDLIYRLADPFVGHPGRSFLVSLAWIMLAWVGRSRRARVPALVAAGAWISFGLLEAEAMRERADIRVDLLLTWPVLCVVSVVAAIVWFRRLVKEKQAVGAG